MACKNYLTVRKPNSKEYITVPCGKCMPCRIAYRNSWVNRMQDEALSRNDETSFITLTYDDDTLPVVHDGVDRYPTLFPSHVQKFLKRYRYYRYKECPFYKPLKYYAVGEYGDSSGRPHYHLVMFGVHPVRDINLLKKSWTQGIVDALYADVGLMRYLLKYLDKQCFDPEERSLVYRYSVPPFHLVSKGIGRDYLDEHFDELSQGIYYRKGKRVPIPRYYSCDTTVSGSLAVNRFVRSENNKAVSELNRLAKEAGFENRYRYLENQAIRQEMEYMFKESNKTRGV